MQLIIAELLMILRHAPFPTSTQTHICTLMAVVLMLQSCEPVVEPIRTFTIAEGNHYANERYSETLQSNILTFEARFNQTAIYQLGDASLQSNINKLMGFSDCNSPHHENSARFGWRWHNDQLEIYAYCYVNAARIEKFIGTVPLDEYSNYKIELLPDKYVFQLNNTAPVSIERGTTCDRGVYFMLWPYFGGSVPAPHQIKIEIKQLSQ